MPEFVADRVLNWASDIEQGTILQAARTARLPIIASHIALMPDAHLGRGATVGSVIPTENAIIPSAVGVDIGCGMIAAEFDLAADDLPDDLRPFLPLVERAVPAGVGAGHETASNAAYTWMRDNPCPAELETKQGTTALEQFGSLGSGNHFFEVCLDERDRVWLVLHSGSRGIGNKLAQVHIGKAKHLARENGIKLEDPDLAYFTQEQPEFHEYIATMLWAQDYAKANRQQMMAAVVRAFQQFVGHGKITRSINCHHNFTQLEHYPSIISGGLTSRDRVPLWITRKGAIKADKGDFGVIPGSMGTRSYIVEGLGNMRSWNSCAHGAGRRLSRSQAKKQFTVEDLREQMAGKVWLDDRAGALLDEIPSSYKDIDAVMEDQKDLVKVHHVLHQVLNFKGA